MEKYYKNLILCGLIDYYCLICEETIQLGKDLEKHIRWEKHRKNMKNQAYLPKFKNDCIYKVGNIYYCEFCNITTTKLALTNDHINSESHKTSKTRTEPISFVLNTDVKKRDSNIVICSNIITKAEWHGIENNKCNICDTNVENPDLHIATPAHMIKFMKLELVMKDLSQYYRKINENLFQCFVCKKTNTMDSFDSHWQGNEHINTWSILKHLQKIDEAAGSRKPYLLPTPNQPRPGTSRRTDLESILGLEDLDICVDDIVKKATGIAEKRKREMQKVDEVKSAEKAAKMAEVEKQLLENLKDDYELNYRIGEAKCKKCPLDLELNFRVLVEHKKIFHSGDESWELKKSKTRNPDKFKMLDHGQERRRISAFGKSHYIRLTSGGKRGYCMVCNCLLVPSFVTIETHLNGIRHRGLLYLAGLSKKEPKPNPPKEKITTLPLLKFLTGIYYEPGLTYLWINMKYWVEVRSFLLLSKVDGDPQFNMLKCNACTKIFKNTKTGELEHWRGDVHKEKYLASNVVVDRKGELIREIRPNVFHCGSCNQIFPYWSTVERHIKSWQHNIALSDQDFFDTFVKEFKHDQHFKTSDDDEVFYELQLKSIMEKVNPKE